MAKRRYKVGNWREYNRALKERYRLTILVSEEVSWGWYAGPSGKRGAPRRYSDLAIGFALTIRVLFRLPLRGCEGVLEALLEPLGLAVPDYTTLSRPPRQIERSYQPSRLDGAAAPFSGSSQALMRGMAQALAPGSITSATARKAPPRLNMRIPRAI